MNDTSLVHTKQHIVQKLDQSVIDSLYVITVVFNPWRYRTRVDLFHDFEEYVEKSGGKLVTIELAFGERPFIVTDAGNPMHIQVRTDDELWHKERLINLAIERIPPGERVKVAWVDADVRFSRPDWVKETIQLLQHYPIIQMFSKVCNLSPTHEVLDTQSGIIWAYQSGLLGETDYRYYERFHPGFAWAARRSTLDRLGGLLDIAILGSGDRHMAQALIGKVRKSYPSGISSGYIELLEQWQKRAVQHVQGDVGYMPGQVFHYWHGAKRLRRYTSRWKILIDNKYDPEFDLQRDSQGLHKFTGRNPKLKQDIRRYFMQRNEDDISL